jgi:hypothetical protein
MTYSAECEPKMLKNVNVFVICSAFLTQGKKSLILMSSTCIVTVFKESTEWFAGLPHIKKDGICIIGLSKGTMYALELCRRLPVVSAMRHTCSNQCCGCDSVLSDSSICRFT